MNYCPYHFKHEWLMTTPFDIFDNHFGGLLQVDIGSVVVTNELILKSEVYSRVYYYGVSAELCTLPVTLLLIFPMVSGHDLLGFHD
ncbi:hypothetical protein GQ43DRAFT_12060 [Delitschia confertaspora ATCC 74209]|uniref:Uncharacterized protein n=1 Tax=Delitschia confertaspora ATCC 74209 TaxID=1513339 RepID=A0A9P4JRS6_9PLEO|nr:hypothetical protein GQ43DRAFT_12060 [Delitschia confertaspora ATCC 74209]